MPGIQFNPRWREELVATSDEGVLIFELMMGTYHVYFPDQATWIKSVPQWAREKWETYSIACQKWCMENKIPFTIVDNALVYESKDRN